MDQLPVLLDIKSQLLQRAAVLPNHLRGKMQRDILTEHLVVSEPHFRSVANLQPSRQRVATRQFAAGSPR